MAAAKVFVFNSTGTKFASGTMLCITSIRAVWSNTAVAGNEVQIQDAAGNVIYDAFAAGPDDKDGQRFEKWPLVNGLIVQTLTNAVVYVEVD